MDKKQKIKKDAFEKFRNFLDFLVLLLDFLILIKKFLDLIS